MKNSNLKKFIMILALSLILFLIIGREKIMNYLEEGYMSAEVAGAYELKAMLDGKEEISGREGLFYNDHELAYDDVDRIYYVTQNMEKGEWGGFFSSSYDKLYWKKDPYFKRYKKAIAEGHIFTLYGVNEEESNYCIWQIVFTGMPIMAIKTETGNAVGDEQQKADMWISDMKFAGKEYQSCGCQVSVRGQSSRNFAKQGYKLVLNRKMSMLGMRKDEDWILAALYDDDGLIHNKFSYDVWRNIAADNSVAKDDGTTMEYVELFCNDIYMGVYGLVERIDARELSLNKNDILYKCRGFGGPDETIEEDFGLSTDYDIKWPKEYSRDTWVPIKEYLDIFTAEQIENYDRAKEALNFENAIDHNIFIILARACDNYVRKNTFYIAEYNGGKYTIIKVPWNCNATWGNGLYKGNMNRKLYHRRWIEDVAVWSSDIKAMYQCYPDEIQRLTAVRWAELRRDILSEENLIQMLDEEFDYLHSSGAYNRNYVRWNEHGREHWKDEYIYEYVRQRLAFLDEYFKKLAYA